MPNRSHCRVSFLNPNYAVLEGLEPRVVLDSTPVFDMASAVRSVDAQGYSLGAFVQVRAADVDGDGRQDLVAAGGTSGPQTINAIRLAVFTNRGGAFEMTQVQTFGTLLGDLELGDLDRDGDLDIVISDFGDSFQNIGGSLIVVPNNAGTFGTPLYGWVGPNRNAGTSLSDVDLADFNRDGILDAVVSMNGVSATLLGNGSVTNPAFAPAQQFGGADRFVPADFDGDGVTDLAAMLGTSISVFFGDFTTGALGNGYGVTAASQAFSLSAGDLNGDGRDDLVASSSGIARVLISHAQVRTQGFASTTDYSTSAAASEAMIADVDGDGFRDLVSRSTSAFTTWHGGASGALDRRMVSRTVDSASNESTCNWALANIDADPLPDIVSVSTRGEDFSTSLWVFRNIASALPERRWAGTTESLQLPLASRYDAVLGDLTGDGVADLVASGAGVAGVLWVVAGGPGGLSQRPSLIELPGIVPSRVVLADADNDGDRDVYLMGAVARTVYLMTNAAGTLNAPRSVYVGAGASLSALDVADVTGDGIVDLVLGESGPAGLSIVPGTLAGGVYGTGAAVSFSVTGTPLRVAAVDFDGDGSRDVAWLADAPSGAWVARFVNGVLDGDNVLSFAASQFPINLATRDVTGDGKPDLSVSTFNDHFLVQNTSQAGVFSASRQGTVTPGFEGRLVVADLTGDGVADRAWRSAGLLDVLTGTGTQEQFLIPSGNLARPDAVLVADVTGDGLADEVRFDDNGSFGYSVNRGKPMSRAGWSESRRVPGEQLAGRLPQAADLNGDGISEIVTTAQGEGLAVWSSGGGAIGAISSVATAGLMAFRLADIDNDADIDIVYSNESGEIRAHLNPGNGVFGGGSGSFVLSAGQTISAFVVGDLNADGRNDVVLHANQSAQVRTFFRNGAGGFDAATVISSATVGGIAAMELGRFARGAFPDLVLATNAGTYLLRNATGAGFTTFAAGLALSNSAGVQRIDVVDLNADAVPDLVLGNFQSNIVLGVVNTSPVGAISFGATVLSTLGTDVNFFGSYVVGDLDADGRADLLGLQTKNRLLRGSGTGAFIAAEDYRRITTSRLAAVFGQRDTDPALELFVVGADFIDVVDSLNPISIVPPTIQSVVPSDDAYARGQPLALTVGFGAPAASGSRVRFFRDNGNGVLDNGDVVLGTVPATASGAVFNQVIAADAPAGLMRVFALPLTPAGIAGVASSATFTVIDRTISVQVVGTAVSPAAAATVFTVSIRYQVDGSVANLDASSLSNGDVTLTTPTGGVIVGALGVVTPNGVDRTITCTYNFAAPGGFWDFPDNGAYALNLVADQVAFAGGQGFLAAQALQTFNLFFQNPIAALGGTVLNGSQLIATIRYTDNVTMSWGSMDNGDVELRGPNGLIIPAVLTSRVINPSTTISATYTFAAPGGGWDSPDNGAYELWVRPTQVWDAMGYPIATQRLTVYNLWFNNPTAERVSEVVSDGGTFFDLTVRYTDLAGSPLGISWGSIGDGDVELAGPGGYLESGVLRSRSIPAPGLLVATYRFRARGGAWDHTDNGSYTARTRANQVIDNQGYTVPALSLRTYGLYFVSPSVNAVATDVAAGRADLLVAVTYRAIGSTLMSWSSIGDGDDLELSGPAGFTAVSSLVSRVYNATTNTYTVTYRLGAPGGTWNSADNGAYVLRTRVGEVIDALGRPVPAYDIASYSLFF